MFSIYKYVISLIIFHYTLKLTAIWITFDDISLKIKNTFSYLIHIFVFAGYRNSTLTVDHQKLSEYEKKIYIEMGK